MWNSGRGQFFFLLCWLLPTAQATARLRLPALVLESPQKQHVGRHRAQRAASAGLQGFGGKFYTRLTGSMGLSLFLTRFAARYSQSN